MSANQEQQKMVETALTGLETTQEEASRNRAKSMLSLRSLQEPVDLTVEKEPSDEEVVKGMLSKMFEMNLENPDTQEGILLSISNKNKGVMAKASQFTSAKLDARMGDLKGSEEGNALFNEMTSLNKTLREIHPSKFDMTETFFQKYLPFVASPVRKYFDQFRTTKSVIDETRGKLEKKYC